MAYRKRNKTSYKGVFFFEVESKSRSGKPDKLYFIRYLHPHTKKLVEEKIGLSSAGWTPAKCATEKGKRESGLKLPNTERRQKTETDTVWTYEKIFEHYNEFHPRKNERNDNCLFNNHLRDTEIFNSTK